MKKLRLPIFLLLSIANTFSQSRKTENLIVVVLDGMRWQEIFGGADSLIINNPLFTKDKNRIQKQFWDNDPSKRREMLFPFLWKTLGTNGQIYGNRNLKNEVNVSNPFQMTYPGFSEMLTGYADPAISSNRLIVSKSDNVLEFINKQKNYEGKVAVFATSDLFPYLLNRHNSKLYINSDTDTLGFNSKEFNLLNEMQKLTSKPTTERPDLLTYFAAKEYLKAYKPKVLYLALGETDAFAHQGNYDQYLETAKAEDNMIAKLWKLAQSIPQYKNKTTLILTCDHGRGDLIKEQWTAHGPKIQDSGQIWIAAIGPDTKALGEVKTPEKLFQAQLAASMAAVLGFTYLPKTHEAMKPVFSIFTK
ncbi:alkaline phosphatase family protein [Dyadobacter subterraneus]|uniref:Alkaline phosphatase family protein n=1 Tax=Dyadobacter subterraneus TaxID=2773304 RepID=A0ABR9W4X2_9BACT|nr:alkaline phosphatase family protein [Dyadobacter subterraneus]MBE9460493.1 alkaline phosphatase family protein [Dyadobacter subterraneus]